MKIIIQTLAQAKLCILWANSLLTPTLHGVLLLAAPVSESFTRAWCQYDVDVVILMLVRDSLRVDMLL